MSTVSHEGTTSVQVERMARIEDLLHLERIPLDPDPDKYYIQIGIRSFGNGVFHRDEALGSELSKLRYFEVKPGRLIVSNIMAWEGAIAVSSAAEKGCVGSSRFLSYVPVGDVDLRYLNYYFQTQAGRALIRSTSTGTVVRNQTLSIKDFGNLVVPLPSLEEQRRIAARLDAAMKKLDSVDMLRQRLSYLSKAISESAISDAISKAATMDRLGDLVTPSRVPIDINPEESYRAFGMRSFGKGVIRYEPTSGAELSKLRYFKFPSNALVLSNIKAWEGAIGVTSPEDTVCVASNRFLFYVPDADQVNVSYLRHYLLSRRGLAQVSAASPGSADRNRTLSIKGLEAIKVPLPVREVQDKAAHLIEETSTLGGRQESGTQERLRKAILHAAFTGQL